MCTSSRLLAALIVTIFMLSSCGGGGGSSTSPAAQDPAPTNNSVPSVILDAKQGQILLGPVVDASIEIFDATDLEGPTICAVSSSSIDAEVGPGVVDLSDCS